VTKTAIFRIELLDKQDRSAFDCGSQQLNAYLKNTAGQDVRRGLATCFVSIDNATDALAGYYTLSASSVTLQELPKDQNFGRYTSVPAILIGRLAVDKRFQSLGLGRQLLYDAIREAAMSRIGVALLVVSAKNDKALNFYRHCGFQVYGSSGDHLFMSMKDVKRAAALG